MIKGRSSNSQKYVCLLHLRLPVGRVDLSLTWFSMQLDQFNSVLFFLPVIIFITFYTFIIIVEVQIIGKREKGKKRK